MVDVCLKEILHRPKGIGIRSSIEIECATQEVTGRIAQEKLFSRCCISANPEKYSADMMGGEYKAVFDGTRHGFVFVREVESIIHHPVEFIYA